MTGGLKTVNGMVNALQTVDGVGLARTLCQEPHFCSHILSSQITGAILQKLDPNNFDITAVAAGVQIKQIGKDLQPINLGLQENTESFLQSVSQWAQDLAEDKKGQFNEFPVLSNYHVPYNTGVA